MRIAKITWPLPLLLPVLALPLLPPPATAQEPGGAAIEVDDPERA